MATISQKKYRRLQVLGILGGILLCSGIYGWISGLDDSWFGPKYEMPLGDLRAVAVDSSGSIYCHVEFGDRIQKYDPQGRFLYSLYIDCGGGAFRFRITDNDELEVATTRNHRLYRYSLNGELIDTKSVGVYFYRDFVIEEEKQYTGPDNSTYNIGHFSILFPRVIKTSPSGQRSTVVSVPIHKWFIMGPLPAWLFALIGGVTSSCVSNYLKKNKPQPLVSDKNIKL